MPANFAWDDALRSVEEAGAGALRQIGTLILARRLHNISQPDLAKQSSARLGVPNSITQPDISELEDGVLTNNLRMGNDKLKAIFQTLAWRPRDIDLMITSIKHFARVT
jgi:hypothetical protein